MFIMTHRHSRRVDRRQDEKNKKHAPSCCAPSCPDVSEVSMVVSSAYFQRPNDILEMKISFRNKWEGLYKICEKLEIM